ncbi:SDR family oxidoreductase [Polynucleobacter sp. AP-Melu-500A-A1]|uniref:UDP-glucose 4-epimerase family protein n=1 Tax=Polynucleobacter sp. AP-Melu-500A-A1 TaxID=2576929 RepID=UPI002106BBA2|nr:SDR family oxidoreductase [Polynucleobacter sp. AP-Melu-500A-A1]
MQNHNQSTEVNQCLQNPCVLITGSSGFVGSRLTNFLSTHFPEMELRLAVRHRPDDHQAPGVLSSGSVEVVGDINPHTNWTDALNGVDLVIHLAARVHVMNDVSLDPLEEYRNANTLATIHLAEEAAKAGVKRFIYLSSIKVNGEETKLGQAYSEDSTPAPIDPYGVSKWEAELGLEKVCTQTGMEFVIIRPPLVYGPGVKANFQKLIGLVAKGLPLPLGAVHNQRSMLALDNLVSFIAEVMTNPLATNQRFLLSDGEDVSTTQLLRIIAKGMGKSIWLLPVPAFILKGAAQVFGASAAADRLLGSLQIDSSKARQLLHWQPPLSVEEGIAITAQSYLKNS